ncbi:MAG: trimethylamine methyltransferase family protein [Victivallales bacterium]|nr:trimethylamine methyltransferase family protein [Victivallales bacterium]
MRTDSANIIEQKSLRFKLLSEDQIKQIHSATLEVLSTTGIFIEYVEVLQLLEKNGCTVEGRVAKFPPGLVEWAVNRAPSQFLLYDQKGKNPLNVGGNNTYFGMGPTLLYMIDYKTGERRKFVKKDTENAALIADALPNIDFVMGLGTISDVKRGTSDIHEFEAMARNTNKPMVIWSGTVRGTKDIIKMSEAVAGGKKKLKEKPFLIPYSEPVSPLSQSENSLKKLLVSVDYGIPTIHTPLPQGGASAPATLAGELVQANAENLSAVVIAQLRNPGTPILIGGAIGTMDMLNASFVYGSPELQLMLAAYMDIARYYKIPTWGTGGCTDSKTLDQQAALEAAQSILYASLSGTNLVHDVGFMDTGITASLGMLVAADEIISMTKFIINGIKVNKDTTAVDIINKVGPAGEYLTEKHTLKHFRDQLWEPELMDRQPPDKWVDNGAETMKERICSKVNYILKNHKAEPKPDSVIEQIDRIYQKYNHNAKKK